MEKGTVSRIVHRFLAMSSFLTSGTVYFVTFVNIISGSQDFFDMMMQLCMASALALLSVIYSVPEAEPGQDDTMPTTRRTHLESAKTYRMRY